MHKRVGLALVAVLCVGLYGATTARADVFRDLVSAHEARSSTAALEILRSADEQAVAILHRAMAVAAIRLDPKSLPHLTQILRSSRHGATTRAIAALTIARFAMRSPPAWPPGKGKPLVHQPLPVFAKMELYRCLAQRPGARKLRAACAEALGIAAIRDALARLQAVVDDASDDPLVRAAAARSVTRLTSVVQPTNVLMTGAAQELRGIVNGQSAP